MSDAQPAIHNSNVRYSSYTPAQKRATQKYRANNKDKVNEQRKAYYEARKEADPEFLAYKREKAKEYYQRKKASIPTSIPDAEQLLPEDMNSAYTGPLDEDPSLVPEEEPHMPSIEDVLVPIEVPIDVPIEVPTSAVKVKKPRAPRKKAIVLDVVASEVELPVVEIEMQTIITAPTPKAKGKVKFYPPKVEEVKEETPITL